MLKNELFQEIEEQLFLKKIYIYGAGVYGRTAYFFLKEKNIDIEAFIVTSNIMENEVLNKKVISIEQYDSIQKVEKLSHTKDIIIVAVSDLYVNEIKEILKEKKITNYIVLSQSDMSYIEQSIKYDNTSVLPQKNIAILLYHRVIDSEYVHWNLNISPQVFDTQMKYISENFHVMRLDDNWDEIVNSDEKYVVITFDDGYVDNYKYALPILEKYKVPATIFVSTDLIDTNDMYWWDELEKIFIIDGFRGRFIFNGFEYLVSTIDEAKQTCSNIRNYLKNIDPIEREQKLLLLRDMLGTEKAETEELRCVSSDEIREMAKSAYVSIGCHTKSHLSMGNNKSRTILQQEVKESKEILERIAGKKIKTFAYPFGGKEDFCGLAEEVLRDNEIGKAVIVKSDNANMETDKYKIPRHMMYETENIEREMNKIWGIYG